MFFFSVLSFVETIYGRSFPISKIQCTRAHSQFHIEIDRQDRTLSPSNSMMNWNGQGLISPHQSSTSRMFFWLNAVKFLQPSSSSHGKLELNTEELLHLSTVLFHTFSFSHRKVLIITLKPMK